MARYDPQRSHARPKIADDEPAPVERLLDLEDPVAEPGHAPKPPPPRPTPVRPTGTSSPAPARPPAPAGNNTAKLVGIGVAAVAVLLVLRRLFARRKASPPD